MRCGHQVANKSYFKIIYNTKMYCIPLVRQICRLSLYGNIENYALYITKYLSLENVL